MGQKSNPISLRLEKTNMHWFSCWYGDYNYTRQLLNDLHNKNFIYNCSQQMGRTSPILFFRHTRGELAILLFSSIVPRFLYRNFPLAVPKSRSLVSNKKMLGKGKIEVNNQNVLQQFVKQIMEKRLAYKTRAKKKKLQLGTNVGDLLLALQLGLSHPTLSVHLTNARGTMAPVEARLRSALPVVSSRALETLDSQIRFQKQLLLTHLHSDLQCTKSLSPNIHVGRNKGLKRLRPFLTNHMQHSIYKDLFMASSFPLASQPRCKLELFKCGSIYHNPSFLASHLVSLLQARVPFRQLKHRVINLIQGEMQRGNCPKIKGVRISCSGRAPARSKKAQKARTDLIQWGESSLNVFSELVHFASKGALTGFGKIGVKVWICYATVGLA